MKVAIAMYVRDEEDVIEANLRAHLALGVDFFLVIDHRSTDRTPEILRRYADAGFVHLTKDESEQFQQMESEWGTTLARRAAAEFGADWVLHADADEFWWPLAADLKSALAEVPETYSALLAPRVEFVARPDGPGSFAERLTVRERFSRVQPKIAHRGHPEAEVPSGAHGVTLPGAQGPTHVGRASLRTRGQERFPGSNRWTPTAPLWPIMVFHFPVRTFEHFKARAELGLFATGRKAKRRRTEHMLEAYEEGRLDEIYAQLTLEDDEVSRGISSGELVEDARLRDLLARCPDPLTEPEELSRFQPVSTDADAEMRAELAQDAMQAMWRAEALVELRAEREQERAELARQRAERRSERIHHLKRQNATLSKRRRRLRRRLRDAQRQLRAVRRNRWWRIGQRLASLARPGRGRASGD